MAAKVKNAIRLTYSTNVTFESWRRVSVNVGLFLCSIFGVR